ncbi:arylsulfatase [Pedobacter endophyticus]|uniref:Arylsulfatase n=1 Tax=Pedobacter endophyticus TaxID=2789740 RepID=A0A7S9PZC5_9SPHI|nr:arylsulfatase [Pedobacter endophyticus]QPH40368.1 arylsulfatase [Pedobacter endophyticus]
MKSKKLFLSLAVVSGSALIFLSAFDKNPKKAKTEVKAERPNIVVILADDMGFSDAGCYGGEINTPNIDFLANNGLRYREFYNTSRCCPTRASLLTGLYNQQAGIGKMTEAENEPGYLGRLADNSVTIAEVLKTAGYNTAMSGKWHVSNTFVQNDPKEQLAWLNHQKDYGDFSPISQYPTSRGFDQFFGTIWGVVDFFDPFSLVSGTKPIKNVPKDYYQTDAINDTAVAYINSWKKSQKPFFLYVAQNAPHWPLQAKPEDIAKYKDTYKGGWDVIREARYKKMAKLGLIDTNTTKLSKPLPRATSWENNPDKVWDAEAMAVHAAMIDRMDQGIGRIIDALRKTGKLDNTIIVFLSDNGASPENAAAYGAGFDRPSETRTGSPIIYATKKQAMPGPQTTYSSIGKVWANVANTPYQYAKAESFEGGIHTPMVAFWPKGIKAQKGGFSNQRGHVMDFMKTFIDLAGAKYPATYKGKTIKPTPGISLVPSFEGKDNAGHEVLFNEHFGARYARSGNWKLVSLSNDTTWHLFDLSKDKTEVNDVAKQNPQKVAELKALWKDWANTNQVFPKPGRGK